MLFICRFLLLLLLISHGKRDTLSYVPASVVWILRWSVVLLVRRYRNWRVIRILSDQGSGWKPSKAISTIRISPQPIVMVLAKSFIRTSSVFWEIKSFCIVLLVQPWTCRRWIINCFKVWLLSKQAELIKVLRTPRHLRSSNLIIFFDSIVRRE